MAPASTTKSSDGSNRRPLVSLQTYPDLKEHEASIHSGSTKPLGVTGKKPIVPPKPTPTPRTKPIRPRSCSAPGPVIVPSNPPTVPKRLEQPYVLQRSNSQPIRPRRGSAPGSVVVSSLEQSYALQRSNSSQPKFPPKPNHYRRARSFSAASAVTSSAVSPPTESEVSLASTLKMCLHQFGKIHPKVGSAWNRLGNYLFRTCQYSSAEQAFKHAIECFPVGEPELACSYSNLGAAHWANGKPEEAIPFLERALKLYELNDITEDRDPDESVDVASTLYQLGLCNILRKQYGEALTCLEKCKKIQAKVLPKRHIQVGRTLDAIGKVHFFKEEYSTALLCHKEARRMKSASGDNGMAIITSLLNIAAVHHATRNWDDALAHYEKVMHLQKSELLRCRNQKGQPLLARAAQELGETLQLMGDSHRQKMEQSKEAKRLYKEAAMLYEEAGLPENDPRMAALR